MTYETLIELIDSYVWLVNDKEQKKQMLSENGLNTKEKNLSL